MAKKISNKIEFLIDAQKKRIFKSFDDCFINYMKDEERKAINKAIYERAEALGVSVYDICFMYVPIVNLHPEGNEIKMVINWKPIEEFDKESK